MRAFFVFKWSEETGLERRSWGPFGPASRVQRSYERSELEKAGRFPTRLYYYHLERTTGNRKPQACFNFFLEIKTAEADEKWDGTHFARPCQPSFEFTKKWRQGVLNCRIREHLVNLERSEQIYLVIRDRSPQSSLH